MILKKIKNQLIINTTRLIFSMRSLYYKAKNKKQKKVFVFTDSRGYEVSCLWNKKNPFSSYVGELIKKYNVEYHICEYSSTTIIDFLFEYERKIKEGKNYDFVVAHIGLVDFSPRPHSMAVNIIKAKAHKIKYLGWDVEKFERYIEIPVSKEIYNGETLSNIYSKSFLKHNVIPRLVKIPGLIYIGCNSVLSNWRGNYWQDRPKDLSNILMDYNAIMLENLNMKNIVNIEQWNEIDIKKYTVDNIHLNYAGYEIISKELDKILIES